MHLPVFLIFAASCALFACGPRDSDKLDDNELAAASGSAGGSDSTRCASRATQDELRRQLFARAAEIRGSNAPDYARISDFAVLQLDNATPVDATISSALAECRARASLRLPAGLRVAGGRTMLGGDIVYSVAGSSGGSVTLGEADSITVPLATMTQRRAPAASPVPPPATVDTPADPLEPIPEPAVEPAPAPPPVVPPPDTNSAARPSFDCRRARTAGERAVCDSPSLAALDREMAGRYQNAIAEVGPADRRLLVQTRDRFLSFRDRCRSDACIAGTYRGRMREIDDIVAGRWQSPR